jgi:hypothetical protein
MKKLYENCYFILHNVKNLSINFGPQHPAAHGVLRSSLFSLFGESVSNAILFDFQEPAPITFFGEYFLFFDFLFLFNNFLIIFFYGIFCIITYNKNLCEKDNNYNFYLNCCNLFALVSLFFQFFVFLFLDDSTNIEPIVDINLESNLDLIKQNKFPVSKTLIKQQFNWAKQHNDSLFLNRIKQQLHEDQIAKQLYSKEFFKFCYIRDVDENSLSVSYFNYLSRDQKLYWVDSPFFKNGSINPSELYYDPSELERNKKLYLHKNHCIKYDDTR